MSEETDVDKVLSKARLLEQAFGKSWGAFILLFALWTMRRRTGMISALGAVSIAVLGWLKLKT
jgi:hypothetical protein